jgi:hypothetical protein
MSEKLTPVYAAFYIDPDISGYNAFSYFTERGQFGGHETVSVTLGKARQALRECQEREMPAYLYQFGWKERGYNKGEGPCNGVVESNEAMKELRRHPERNHGSAWIGIEDREGK